MFSFSVEPPAVHIVAASDVASMSRRGVGLDSEGVGAGSPATSFEVVTAFEAYRGRQWGVTALSADAKAAVIEVLERAQRDETFRALLVDNPALALRDLPLTAAEKGVVGTLRSVDLEELGIDIRPFRGFLSYDQCGGRDPRSMLPTYDV